MSRARMCDRCGTLYRVGEEHKTVLRISKESGTASKYLKPQDLCQKCEESLEKWFKKGEMQ